VGPPVRQTPRFSWRGAFFLVLGLIGVGIGLNAAEYRPFGVALAMLSFALGASLLGKAGRLSAALRPLVGRTVRVEVWGEPLPGPHGGLYDVESVTGIGAGLYFRLAGPDDSGGVLKIAQPDAEALADERIEIRAASYVQWARKTLARPAGTRAPALAVSLP
jgi:hypothetical protein